MSHDPVFCFKSHYDVFSYLLGLEKFVNNQKWTRTSWNRPALHIAVSGDNLLKAAFLYIQTISVWSKRFSRWTKICCTLKACLKIDPCPKQESGHVDSRQSTQMQKCENDNWKNWKQNSQIWTFTKNQKIGELEDERKREDRQTDDAKCNTSESRNLEKIKKEFK